MLNNQSYKDKLEEVKRILVTSLRTKKNGGENNKEGMRNFIRANVGSFDLNNGDKELQNALDGIKRIVLNEELFNDTSYEEFYGDVVATIDLLIETLDGKRAA